MGVQVCRIRLSEEKSELIGGLFGQDFQGRGYCLLTLQSLECLGAQLLQPAEQRGGQVNVHSGFFI